MQKGTLTMPPHPVTGCILQVLVLLIATLHQGIERVVVEVVEFALHTSIWQVPATLSRHVPAIIVIVVVRDITVGVTLD